MAITRSDAANTAKKVCPSSSGWPTGRYHRAPAFGSLASYLRNIERRYVATADTLSAKMMPVGLRLRTRFKRHSLSRVGRNTCLVGSQDPTEIRLCQLGLMCFDEHGPGGEYDV
jgi:hypothetical protein